jgi:hypothetical protein
MSAQDWLGAIGGGLAGYDRAERDDQDRALRSRGVDIQEKYNDLRAMLDKVRIDATNERADKSNTTKREIAEGVGADRRYGVDTRAATSSGNAQLRADTATRGQDLSDTHYWDQAARSTDAQYQTDATRRRGQDIGAGTARRGQDLLHQDRGQAIEATAGARAMDYALNAYNMELKRRKQQSSLFGDDNDVPTFQDWVQSSDDPEIFPSVRDQFGPRTQPVGDTGGVPPPPAAAPPTVAPAMNAAPMGMPGPKPPIPGGRPPAAAAPAMPKGVMVGATVVLKNGQRVVVKKVHPDGTFEY